MKRTSVKRNDNFLMYNRHSLLGNFTCKYILRVTCHGVWYLSNLLAYTSSAVNCFCCVITFAQNWGPSICVSDGPLQACFKLLHWWHQRKTNEISLNSWAFKHKNDLTSGIQVGVFFLAVSFLGLATKLLVLEFILLLAYEFYILNELFFLE